MRKPELHHETWHGFDIWYWEDDSNLPCLGYGCRVREEEAHAFDLRGTVDAVALATREPGKIAAKDRIRELVLARARAIIDLRSFGPAETLARPLDDVKTSDNRGVPAGKLRRQLLRVFYILWQSFPTSYDGREAVVDSTGLCMELGISRRQYSSAMEYLLGKGWLQRSVGGRQEYSHAFITQQGIDAYESSEAATTGAQAAIFINYRHEDTLADLETLGFRLRTHFGQDAVFIARDCIELGTDSEKRIERAARLCQVMVVLIGPKWLTMLGEDGRRRLDDPRDLLRREIEMALQRGIPVIPVLVRGAHVPREDDLPNSLKELGKRQGKHIRESDWERDTAELIQGIEGALGLAPQLVGQVVRDEHGAVFYIDNERERHLIGPDDHKTARFLRSPRGEIPVSSQQLELYPVGDAMHSVLDCELLYVEPGPHIYALLNGKTYYVGMNDLNYWGRNDPRQWRRITEEEFQRYPVGRRP
jgi:hypothetical protein